ncbi:hypothetical protein HDU76_004374 [Blyttiomyces sp. JEL0837]|nr:hypothetical protein HDU76_004374 [Blyttiomyces sp. JEL0837]
MQVQLLTTICICFVICVQRASATSSNAVCGTTSAASVVYISTNSSSRIIQASGCPNYDWTSQTTPNKAQVQCYNFAVPLKPIINSQSWYIGVYKDLAKTTANTKIPLGAIGIARNGVALYGNSDNDDRDAYTYEGHSFDTCKGHPDSQGNYHYHAEPGANCITGYTNTSGTGHSNLLGVMADGIPIFGPYGDSGQVPTDLDECNGHVDSTYKFYHYHVASSYTYPYLVNCLKGCMNGSSGFSSMQMAPSCVAASTQYDYSSLTSLSGSSTTAQTGVYKCDVASGASISAATTTAATTTAASAATTTTLVLKSAATQQVLKVSSLALLATTMGKMHASIIFVVAILSKISSTVAKTKCPTTADGSVVFINSTGSSRIVQSSGCPNYDWSSQSSPNTPTYQCYSLTFPSNPIINTQNYYIGVYTNLNKTTTNTKIPLGPIGMAINGIPLYGNSDIEGRDAYVYEGVSFDTCKGHPDQDGAYHYHAEPGLNCVPGYTNTSGTGHSKIIGIMADGIPIFGPYGDSGVAPTDLDECNGHTDSTYKFYHYHVPKTYTYPYLINCMKGCLNGTYGMNRQYYPTTCTPATTQYDYSSLSSLTGLAASSGTYKCDGVPINGIPLYGNSDKDGHDAYINEGVSFDTCKGHPDQDVAYHYHAEPGLNCVPGYTNTSGTGLLS